MNTFNIKKISNKNKQTGLKRSNIFNNYIKIFNKIFKIFKKKVIHFKNCMLVF